MTIPELMDHYLTKVLDVLTDKGYSKQQHDIVWKDFGLWVDKVIDLTSQTTITKETMEAMRKYNLKKLEN